MVKMCYFAWKKRRYERSKTGIFIKLVEILEKAVKFDGIRAWKGEIADLREIETKIEQFSSKKVRKQQKIALKTLKFAFSRHQIHSEAAIRLIFNRKRRVFRLFFLGCRLSTRNTLNSTIAVAHRDAILYKKSVFAWKLWLQHKIDLKTDQISTLFHANEHYSRILLSKSIFALKFSGKNVETTLKERKKAVFSAWKLQMRESALLQKYLLECNLSQRRLESPKEGSLGSGLSTFRSRRSSDEGWE